MQRTSCCFGKRRETSMPLNILFCVVSVHAPPWSTGTDTQDFEHMKTTFQRDCFRVHVGFRPHDISYIYIYIYSYLAFLYAAQHVCAYQCQQQLALHLKRFGTEQPKYVSRLRPDLHNSIISKSLEWNVGNVWIKCKKVHWAGLEAFLPTTSA